MGAYTPLPKSIVSDAQSIKIHNKVYNLLDAMKREGVYYQGGVMYVGEMMSDDLQDDESDMLEINVRFGNPESQAILPSLTRAGVDVYRLLRSAAEHDLEKPSVDIAHLTGHAAVTVVLAAPGYPDDVKTGQIIHGLDKNYPNVQVTHAAVGKNDQGELITAGGRTIDVTGMGENVQLAARAAYAAIGEDAIHFEGNQFRRDIAKQALTWTAEFRG
jgi:phosphoribosylamine--glycine ligase